MKPNNKLKAEIVLQGKDQSDIYSAINMSKYSWSRKINGISEFTTSEVEAVCKFLKKTPNDLFFAEVVAEIATKTA